MILKKLVKSDYFNQVFKAIYPITKLKAVFFKTNLSLRKIML